MEKNGGKPTKPLLTLEEALRRFAANREAQGAKPGAQPSERVDEPDSNVLYADFSPQDRHDDRRDDDAAPEDSGAEAGGCDEIVAVIDGIPRSLEDLELLAEREAALLAESEAGDRYAASRSQIRSRAAAFTALSAALVLCIALLALHPQPRRLTMLTGPLAPAALTASSADSAEDAITTFVIIADSDVEPASHSPKPAILEDRIKTALKESAFSDIGVSVGRRGDAYLAGEVYGMDEAGAIEEIASQVRGVARVRFLHPDVRTPEGPAYFGVATAWAPDVWGAKVQAVFIGSPADKAGIHPGDVISEFDGQTIPDARTFDDQVSKYVPGQRVQVRVWRDGQPQYVVARLGEMTTVAAR